MHFILAKWDKCPIIESVDMVWFIYKVNPYMNSKKQKGEW